MKKRHKMVGLVGVLVAPMVLSALAAMLPKLGLVVIFITGNIFSSDFGFLLAIALAVAAGFGLVGGQSDPLRPFALALL